jgi:8-hydroxy-5-deazaflavin:NADPH oxidoreductase
VPAKSQHVKASLKEIHKVDIAIIGTGNVGSALAGSFVRAGHNVTIAGRDADKARRVGAATGARSASSARDAAEAAEIVVFAIPFVESGEAVARDIADVVDGKVVIDVTNPVKATYDGLISDEGPSAAELIQGWLPGARVVKAFNTILASRMADPTASGAPIDAFVATDDAAAGATVLELARSIGLRPIAVVPLSLARHLEGLAFLNITLNMANAGSWQSSWRLVGAPVPVAAPVAA